MKQRLENLQQENIELKRALSVCLNKPLLKEITDALSRIKKGEVVGEEEFLKQSLL